MSFFKNEIPKEEWEKKYKKLAEDYDNRQEPHQRPQVDIGLTGEQLRQIALAKKEAAHDAKETTSAEEEKKAKSPRPSSK